MQEIDLGDELKFNIKYKGQAYVLREPTVDEVESLKESGSDLPEFLCKLGMPMDVLRGMGFSKVKTIVDGMLDIVTKKK